MVVPGPPTGMAQSSLGTPSADILNRMFTGRVTATPAMGYTPLLATVVNVTAGMPASGSAPATGPQVVVTVIGFDNPSATPTFTCNFEPRFKPPSSTALTPPAGTRCTVFFPPNDSGGIGWVAGFQDWPS